MGNKIKEKHVKQYKINVICCFDNKIVKKKIYIFIFFKTFMHFKPHYCIRAARRSCELLASI